MKKTIRLNIIMMLAILALMACTATVSANEKVITREESGYAGMSLRNEQPQMAIRRAPKVNSQSSTWRYVDGAYISSNGQPIQGALRKGMDVSEFQGKIDWEKAKADGIEFAILRIGWWYDGTDSQFERNASECERLGIPYGVYLYSYTESPQETIKEAEHTIELLKGHHPTYPVYYDVEDDSIREAYKYSAARISAEADRYCKLIANAGYTPGIYASLYWFNTYLTGTSLDSYEHWVAQWSDSCTYSKPYAMWQCTSAGRVNGISGDVDLDFDFKDRSNITKTRIFGATRYDTAIAIADNLKAKNGVEKFDNIVVASGENYPDALTGCYLAGVKNAPVLMVSPSKENEIVQYIKDNLNEGGHVYILGGAGVVSEDFELALKSINPDMTVRLAGDNRYLTNLEILKASDANDTLLVCSGNNFADALSASAVKLPMLIAGDELTEEQIVYLSGAGFKDIHIIGGTGAVPDTIESQLKPYASGTIDRVAGQSRFDTSVAVAKKFFGDSNGKIDAAMITNGLDYPDGISGGPLAASYGAPMLLVSDAYYSIAKSYLKININNGGTLYILGGSGAVSDYVYGNIF